MYTYLFQGWEISIPLSEDSERIAYRYSLLIKALKIYNIINLYKLVKRPVKI
jgi:hypothetical protein